MELIYWFAGTVATVLVFGYFRMPLVWWTLAAGLGAPLKQSVRKAA